MIALAPLVLALAAASAASAPAVLPLRPYLARQATINVAIGGRTGTFLFDTGEGTTAIGPEFARSIGCRPWGRITGYRMSGEALGAAHCDGLAMDVSGRRFAVPTAIVFDIGALIGSGVPHVDGAVGLDAFAGETITIVPRACIIVENAASLAARIPHATALPVRIVRDAEGTALSVDGAVPTPDGTAWMELDTGNGGSNVVANVIAPLLGLAPNIATAVDGTFALANGIAVRGPLRTRDLILDGDIGARFLNDWTLTLDLANGRAWMAPATPRCA